MGNDSTRTLRDFSPDEILAGRFSVVRCIGSGGMGAVYEAFDLELGRSVALKLIHPEISSQPGTLERFKSEIKLGREVSHPNLCRLYDFGIHHAGDSSPDVVFFTMELLSGATLADHLQDRALPLAEALPIARQIACGLDALHESGIVHRDLKPANIILSTTRSTHALRVVITDFGLARETQPGRGSQTAPGQIVGTPRYMAPEQILGIPLTSAADIYSFGLVLYEMISGKSAFAQSSDFQSARARVSQLPPGPRTILPTLDLQWERAILRALEPDPARRFSTASELVNAFDTEARGRTFVVPKFAKWIAVAAGIAALMGALVFVVPLLFRHKPPPDAQSAYDRGVSALENGAYYSAMVSLADAVARDPQFLLAHGRRAEAANRLQFMDEAQTEIASAMPAFPASWTLNRADVTRIRAIRAKIRREWPEALKDYQSLVDSASDNEKPEALSNLAEVYGDSGDSTRARALYEQALSLNSSYAPALMGTGLLLAHAGKTKAALDVFHRAELVYRSPADAEAHTEVLYEEGRALAASSDPQNRARAREILASALASASSPVTEDPFQKVTILLQLSLLAYQAGDTAKGSDLAQTAMDTARSHSIEVLATSALVDLGNALLLQGNTDRAGAYYRDALSAAANHSLPSVQARASMQLSQILLLQGQSADALAYARKATEFYARAGRKTGGVAATIVAARAERDLNQDEAALASFKTALEGAKAIDNREFAGVAEEGIASVLWSEEMLPGALEHYQVANTYFDPQDAIGIANNAVNRAGTLGRLGNSKGAAALVDFVRQSPAYTTNHALTVQMNLLEAQLALIQTHADVATRAAMQAAEENQGQDLERAIDAHLVLCEVAEPRYCDLARAEVSKSAHDAPRDALRLAIALADLRVHKDEAARQEAVSLLAAIPAGRLPETSLLAACVASRASQRLSDPALHETYAARVHDSLKAIETKWGAAWSESFLSRPDVKAVCDPL